MNATVQSGALQDYAAPAAGAGPAHWYALHTSANHEKQVAARLEARAVPHFLPLYRSIRRWKDRRVALERPLFPGYLFVHLAAGEQLRALEVPGVARLVGFGGRPYPLADREIDLLRAGVAGGVAMAPHSGCPAGARVRVFAGPLAGLEGILVRQKNAHRVVITLAAIARSASIEVDASSIEFLC